MTCLCKSVGVGGTWPFLSLNWPLFDPDESTEEAAGELDLVVAQG